MNVIFLDIDGVLNTSDTFIDMYYQKSTKFRMDCDRLMILKYLVNITNSKIVLCATDRVRLEKINNKIAPRDRIGKSLLDRFNEFDIDIYDRTDNLGFHKREVEILKYINEHDIDNFCIIDDSINDYDYLKKFLIHTKNGLDETYIDSIIDSLIPNKKIIFLDIDGVLNNPSTSQLLDIKNIQVLKKIITLSNALVVITSSNKYEYQVTNIPFFQSHFYQYLKILSQNDIPIYKITPLVNKNKELEIEQFLNKHLDITNFLILDDLVITKKYQTNLHLVDNTTGLQETDVKNALAILNGIYENNYKDEINEEKILVRKLFI